MGALRSARDYFADRFESVQYARPRAEKPRPDAGMQLFRGLLWMTRLWILLFGGAVVAAMLYVAFFFVRAAVES